MPRGDKSAYTDKQQRMAEHIEESYENRGVSGEEAERRAWATVNKETGGGRKTAGGRQHSNERIERREGTSSPSKAEHKARSEAAKKGWATRRRNGKG